MQTAIKKRNGKLEMVHQYKNNGYNIVLDVNSGSVHVVDDMVYDIIALYEKMPLDTIVEELENKYPENDIREAYSEIEQLKEADSYLQKIFMKIISMHLKTDRRL